MLIASFGRLKDFLAIQFIIYALYLQYIITAGVEPNPPLYVICHRILSVVEESAKVKSFGYQIIASDAKPFQDRLP